MAEEKMSSGNPITIFIHIPRTAGTTLQAIAREQYAPIEILRIYGKDIVNPAAALHRWNITKTPEPNVPMIKWIPGHIAYGIHHAIGTHNTCQYVTFLRDPIERTLSVYHYIRRSPGHHLHKYAKEMALAEFMESGVTTELDNGMVRQIAGTLGELPQKAHPEDMWTRRIDLAIAKTNLATFAVVGITERFAESMEQFRDVLGWRFGELPHINTLKGRPHTQDVGSPTLEVIEHYTRLDQELYEYGLELFNGR